MTEILKEKEKISKMTRSDFDKILNDKNIKRRTTREPIPIKRKTILTRKGKRKQIIFLPKEKSVGLTERPDIFIFSVLTKRGIRIN